MDWREVSVEVYQMAAEAAINIMEELGAQGVVLDDEDNRINIRAYYPDDSSFTHLLAALKKRIYNLNDYGLNTGKVKVAVQLTHDENWLNSWHKFFKPVPLGSRFIVCPGWEKCPEKGRLKVEIDPGMAFGVGSHETTRLSAYLLEKYIDNQNDNMLDIGTGTGILAIIAAKLGVKEVVGVDIDTAAVKAALTNISKNGVGDQVRIIQGDLSTGLEDKYSLIVANLLPDIIYRLIPLIPEMMAEYGQVIFSGIIKERKDGIISCLKEYKLSVVEEIIENEWVSLVARKG